MTRSECPNQILNPNIGALCVTVLKRPAPSRAVGTFRNGVEQNGSRTLAARRVNRHFSRTNSLKMPEPQEICRKIRSTVSRQFSPREAEPQIPNPKSLTPFHPFAFFAAYCPVLASRSIRIPHSGAFRTMVTKRDKTLRLRKENLPDACSLAPVPWLLASDRPRVTKQNAGEHFEEKKIATLPVFRAIRGEVRIPRSTSEAAVGEGGAQAGGPLRSARGPNTIGETASPPFQERPDPCEVIPFDDPKSVP